MRGLVALPLLLSALAGCQHSVVGVECHPGLVQCGDDCVPLNTVEHCGACDVECAEGESCVEYRDEIQCLMVPENTPCVMLSQWTYYCPDGGLVGLEPDR